MPKKSSDQAGALTHIDSKGEARMVDVSAKPATERVAVAEGRVVMSKATLELIVSGNAKKGDVLGTARIAGIMAAKRTSELIPLCHPLALSKVELDITTDAKLPGCTVQANVRHQAIGNRDDLVRDQLPCDGTAGDLRARLLRVLLSKRQLPKQGTRQS